MKSFVALTFLFAFTLALSTASVVKTQQSEAFMKCEAKVFVELTKEAVTDVYDFYNTVGTSYEGVVEGALQCVADYSDFTDLVSCVADILTTWVEGFSGALETFFTDLITLGEELTDDIYNCKSSTAS